MSRLDWVNLLYIVGFALFIVGLRMVRGPRTRCNPTMNSAKPTMYRRLTQSSRLTLRLPWDRVCGL